MFYSFDILLEIIFYSLYLGFNSLQIKHIISLEFVTDQFLDSVVDLFGGLFITPSVLFLHQGSNDGSQGEEILFWHQKTKTGSTHQHVLNRSHHLIIDYPLQLPQRRRSVYNSRVAFHGFFGQSSKRMVKFNPDRPRFLVELIF